MKFSVIMKNIVLIILVLGDLNLYADSDSLKKLIRIAFTNNPELKSLKNEYYAKEKEVLPSYFPPDPTISFNLMNIPVDTFAFDKSPMSSKQIAFKQMIPFPTKLIYKGKIKSKEADIDRLSYLLFKERLKLNIRLKYYNIAYLNSIIKIENKKKEQLNSFEKIAEIKYKVGKGLQQDLLKAKVRLAYTEKRLVILKTKRRNRIDEIIKIIGIKKLPYKIGFSYNDEIIELDKGKILEVAKKNFWGIKLKKVAYSKAEYINSLAKWNFFPDIMLGAAYSIRDDNLPDKGTDFYTLSLGLVFPLYFPFKQTPHVSSTKRKQESARESLKDMENTVKEKINVHFQLYKQNRDIFKLFKTDIVPEAKLSLDSALKSYQVDKVDFLNVLQSLINLYNSYSEMEKAKNDIHTQLAFIKYYVNDNLIRRKK